jgi:hypothetical protein
MVEAVRPSDIDECRVPRMPGRDITDADRELFFTVTRTRLTPEQETIVSTPAAVHPGQRHVLATHWHPEFVPMGLIARRIDAMFPGAQDRLVIPTQHNVLTGFGDYLGVEIDCFSRGFNQKVQLLVHFRKEKAGNAGRLEAMLAHTFRYRASQLFEFIASFTRPDAHRLNRAAAETGASRDLVEFVRIEVGKVGRLLEAHGDQVSPDMIKNKLLRNFLDGLTPEYGEAFIARAQVFLRAVKTLVKQVFPIDYFYRTSEVVEEARSIGAGIVIPHPEQFWPILLQEYDVDGCEVWNPQSRKYTEFLISVIDRNNRRPGFSRRPVLVFMGDDTHVAEKIRDPRAQDPEKAGREIGVQPAWEDYGVEKALIRAEVSREAVIRRYRERLDGE